MNVVLKVAGVALATALMATIAMAQAQGVQPGKTTKGNARAEAFAQQNRLLQEESTNSPIGSPPVNRNAKPADPIPKATNRSQEIARFKTMDRQLQRESTSSPVGSPTVNKSQAAADPLPKGGTKADRQRNANAEEHFLEQNSSR